MTSKCMFCGKSILKKKHNHTSCRSLECMRERNKRNAAKIRAKKRSKNLKLYRYHPL